MHNVFCWITEGQIKHRKCGIEDRQRERERERKGGKGKDEGNRRERDRERETAWKTVMGWETIFCFALCYTLFTQDLLIFDMCLALFSASPSLASPSLWQLESGRALRVDTHADNKTQRLEKYKNRFKYRVCSHRKSHKVSSTKSVCVQIKRNFWGGWILIDC